MSERKNNITMNRNLYLIITLFFLAELLINPIGEFPLNDDWAYTKMVHNSIIDKEIHSPQWGGSIFLIQLYIGVLISKIFGFSFTILRIIEILFGIIGIVLIYQILLLVQNSSNLAMVGSILFGMNPVYLSGTNSFHPDVPHIMFMLVSLYFFMKYFFYEKMYFYFTGILFAIIACGIKQTGIAIGFAFSVIYLFNFKINIKNIVTAIFPSFVLIVLILSYGYVRNNYNIDLPGVAGYAMMKNIFMDSLFNTDFEDIKRIFFYSINTVLSLGFLVFPLTFPVVARVITIINPKRSNIAILALSLIVLTLIIAIKVYLRGSQGSLGGGIWYMPFVGSTIYDFGVGPIIMTGIEQNEIPGVFKAGIYFWFIVSVIGALGFISFIYLLSMSVGDLFSKNSFRLKNISLPFIFPLLIMFFSLIPYVIVFASAKYLILYLPFMIISTISSIEYLRKKYNISYLFNYKAIFILAIPIIIFGIFATHDYMSFHRIRWEALNYLTENEKIPVEKIDGGFEFNEWHLSHFYTWKMTDDPNKKGRFWPVVDDEYIVTVTEIEGYEMFKQLKYKRWLPPGKHNINVLRRTTR